MTIDLNERLRAAADSALDGVRLEHPAVVEAPTGPGREPRFRFGGAIAGVLVAAAAVVLALFAVGPGDERVETSDDAAGISGAAGADPLGRRVVQALQELEHTAWSVSAATTVVYDDGGSDDVAVGTIRFDPPDRVQYHDSSESSPTIIRDGSVTYTSAGDDRWAVAPADGGGATWVTHAAASVRSLRCWAGLSGRDGVAGWKPDGHACGNVPPDPTVIVTWASGRVEEVVLTEVGWTEVPSGRTGTSTTVYRFDTIGDDSPAITVPTADQLGGGTDVATTTVSVATTTTSLPVTATPLSVGSKLPHLLSSSLHEADQSGRPLVVVFAASWCAPCRSIVDDLRTAALGGLLPGGVDVVVVAYRDGDDSLASEFFAGLVSAGVSVVDDRAAGDHGPGPIATALGVVGLPATVVVGADGFVVDIAAGDGRSIGDLLDSAAAAR